MKNDSTLQSHNSGSGEENRLEKEIPNTVQELPDASSQVEKGGEEEGETQVEVIEKEKEKKTNREGESIIPAPTSDLHPSISVEEERDNSSSCHLLREEVDTEAKPPNPDLLHHPIQRHQSPTRGSHLTKRDKKIIEKIRSYYEAAAEAEEDEAEEEDEQGEGVESRRRNSFSQIPSGLVKESVSRFDVGGHQEEPESGRSKQETTEATDRETDREAEPFSPTGPISSLTPLLADAENDGQADKPISSLDFDAEGPVESPTSTIKQDKEVKNQVALNLQLNSNRPVGGETEIQETNGKVCKGPLEDGLEERQEGKTSVVATGMQGGHSLQGERPSITKQHKCVEETTKTSTENQAVMNGHDSNQAGPAKPNGSHKEPSPPLPPTEQCHKSQSTWTRTKQRDHAKTSGNLEGLHSQIKVGRWSRHSKIVTANRALFEGMGSDVAGIGLFEASPVVDPVLMENSERILSKVQTLARMYSAKASTMKVPLHQKRASAVRNQPWGSGRLSEHSTQTQTKSQTQVQSQTQIQTPTEYQQQSQNQMKINQSDTQSQIQTKSQMWSQAQTHYQCQNQTRTYSHYQTQTMSQEDQRIQEEMMIKRADSWTNGRLTFLNLPLRYNDFLEIHFFVVNYNPLLRYLFSVALF